MKTIICAILTLASMQAFADQPAKNSFPSTNDDLPVINNRLGLGTPAPMITLGNDQGAYYVDDGYYHAPQYMPGSPTAATIWPRVVQLNCEKNAQGKIVCEGYNWSPDLGRGEYLFVVPKLKTPQCCTPIVILKEVPEKKPDE